MGWIFDASLQGIIFAIMALGVYLTFRILDFPDLTVDGSFVTGAAVCTVMIVSGISPLIATFSALIIGFVVGAITGILHTKGKINALLSGILMMIALYSINLRIMGLTSDSTPVVANLSLLGEDTVLTKVADFFNNLGFIWGGHSWGLLFFLVLITFLFKFILDLFLKTEVGLAIRATGDNKKMIRSFSANTDSLIIIGVGISNAFVAFSGAVMAQYYEFSNVNMGIGMIVIGLASVIIGEALFGTKTIGRITLAVILGSVIYRIVIGYALQQQILDASDMKLVTAIIVILALVIPNILEKRRAKKRKMKRQHSLQRKAGAEEGKASA
ncbi:ABC transporter permease [Bacillus kwashiorkori]|uniref:ABC transporter permease n=1 Tax=Bacillus kwashiorkori TaxID=1522318 RepID=UPI000785C32C|nr:ABC transporter permease [Bacillus kwashiorkori]